MAGDQVVDMVSVRHHLMPAVRAMAMSDLVPVATMGRGACCRVLCRDAELVFVDVLAMYMMQVSVVQIVGVAIM
jgi:hypothetical protein